MNGARDSLLAPDDELRVDDHVGRDEAPALISRMITSSLMRETGGM